MNKYLKQALTKYLIAVCFALTAFAQNSVALDQVYTGFLSDTAIKGYDTVAYFTENAAIKGKPSYRYDYLGATWLFVSEANRAAFVANPEKYMPQYGGYCAYAVANNTTASIQPDQFTVLDGKLYLNYNADINSKWRANTDEFIKSADQHWPTLLSE